MTSTPHFIHEEIKAQRGDLITQDLRDTERSKNPGLTAKLVVFILIYLQGGVDGSGAGREVQVHSHRKRLFC